MCAECLTLLEGIEAWCEHCKQVLCLEHSPRTNHSRPVPVTSWQHVKCITVRGDLDLNWG